MVDGGNGGGSACKQPSGSELDWRVTATPADGSPRRSFLIGYFWWSESLSLVGRIPSKPYLVSELTDPCELTKFLIRELPLPSSDSSRPPRASFDASEEHPGERTGNRTCLVRKTDPASRVASGLIFGSAMASCSRHAPASDATSSRFNIQGVVLEGRMPN
jgi:hypothetical protein